MNRVGFWRWLWNGFEGLRREQVFLSGLIGVLAIYVSALLLIGFGANRVFVAFGDVAGLAFVFAIFGYVILGLAYIVYLLDRPGGRST